MPTTFLFVLRDLLKKQLEAQISTLEWQAGYPQAYNKPLSLQQAKLLNTLSDAIVRFEGGATDKESCERIIVSIERTKKEVIDARTEAAKEDKRIDPDHGGTVTCLQDAIERIKKSIDQVTAFKHESSTASLLNNPYLYTPLLVLEQHVITYVLKEIFLPRAHTDQAVREKKEAQFKESLWLLNQSIIPDTLTPQRTLITTYINRLTDGNDQARKGSGSRFFPKISVMSVFSFDFSGAMSAGEGRMKEELLAAQTTIDSITPEQFGKPIDKVLSLAIEPIIKPRIEPVPKPTIEQAPKPVQEPAEDEDASREHGGMSLSQF